MIDQCGRKRDLIGLGSPAPHAFVYLSFLTESVSDPIIDKLT